MYLFKKHLNYLQLNIFIIYAHMHFIKFILYLDHSAFAEHGDRKYFFDRKRLGSFYSRIFIKNNLYALNLSQLLIPKMDDQILGVHRIFLPWPKIPVTGVSGRTRLRPPYYLTRIRGILIVGLGSSGLSPKNGPPAASPAARASGTGRCAARYSSSSAKPSPSCRTASAPARNRSKRRSARWSRAACWITTCPTGSTRSAIADTPSQAWQTRTVDHRPVVPAEAATTAVSRSPRVATCKLHTRGRKLATPPAARLA